jgi:hypothetical protein
MDLGQAKFTYGDSIFDTVSAASKNKACFKSCKNRLKNNHLPTLIKIRKLNVS